MEGIPNLSEALSPAELSPEEEEIVREIKSIRSLLLGQMSAGELYALFKAKATEIKARHPDFNNYKLFHVLMGSSPGKAHTAFDFPDQESSVLAFVRSLREGQKREAA